MVFNKNETVDGGIGPRAVYDLRTVLPTFNSKNLFGPNSFISSTQYDLSLHKCIV